ncbi:MAG: M48 family metallopeptidase [Leptolyngbyaceae cyanobacterium RM1_1_2]|nr:M48 family metallopeptidase [Leptolyngbyaceae cyanobacterium RM1_1_2]
MKISPYGEIEVVVPPKFDPQQLSAILHQKQAWIEQTLARLAAQRQVNAEPTTVKPSQIKLRSLDETWEIVYLQSQRDRLQVIALNAQRLALAGPSHQVAHCHSALRQWLKLRAKQALPHWLQQLSQAAQLPYTKVTIRGQKTRWGSCSSQQHISLNYKLLFLPPPLVDYVLIHELCHTQQMNHSPAFWQSVEQQRPDYQRSREQLKKAWQYIPQWLESDG